MLVIMGCDSFDPNNRTVTHQQSRGDRDDICCGVLCGDVLTGFGNVPQDISMDNSPKDKVNMTNEDES